MSKVLVVVYSWTGTSRRLAELLCSWQHWVLGEIHEARPGRGTARCILDSIFHRQPDIHYAGPEPDDFDAVVLVSPVWAHRLAGPMRSFVASRRSRLRSVAVISMIEHEDATTAVSEVAQFLGCHSFVDVSVTRQELENGSFAPKLESFADDVEGFLERADALTQPAVWHTQAA
jgi:hypothetical protein